MAKGVEERVTSVRIRFPSSKVAVASAKIAVALWLVVAGFSPPGYPIGIGLDPSFLYGINAVRSHGLQFGSDVVYTYGPLGYLAHPLPVGANLASALAIHAAIAAGWFVFLAHVALTRLSLPRLLLIALLLAVTPLWPDGKVLLFITALCGLGLSPEMSARRSAVLAGTASFLACGMVFAKFSSGAGGVGVVAAMLAVQAWTRDRRFASTLAAAAAGGAAAVLAVMLTQFHDLAALARWVQGSLEVARGYSSAMSLVGPAQQLWLAGACVCAYAVMLAMNRWSPPDSRQAWICLPAMYVFFRGGFVRQDIHVMNFFGPFVALTCALLLVYRSRTAFRRAAVVGVLGAIACAVVAAKLAAPDRPGLIGVKAVWQAATLGTTRAALWNASVRDLAPDRLSDDYASRVRSRGWSVDVIPWETSVIAANGFRWRPAPVFQHFSLCTAWLDELGAEHYRSGRSADLILVHFGSINRRHMLWDSPATWRSIVANYSVAPEQPGGGIFLALRRNDGPGRNPALEARGEDEVIFGAWREVPVSEGMLFAEIPLELSLRGRAAAALFRVPPVLVDTVLSNGKRRTWRLTPGTAENGILMSSLPESLQELKGLLAGQAGTRIASFRIQEQAALYFHRRVRVRWREMPFPSAASETVRHREHR